MVYAILFIFSFIGTFVISIFLESMYPTQALTNSLAVAGFSTMMGIFAVELPKRLKD
jgi:hypothetical protein